MSRHARGRMPVDEESFRRVHRLTPLLRFWSLILAIVAIFILNFNLEMVADFVTYLRDGHWRDMGRDSLLTLAGFVVVCVVIWFVSELWWRKLGFKIDEEEVSLRHGVLSNSFRSARYDRIQAVDVVESVIARIFGLAQVRVETAGGTASAIQIGYLPKPEAEEVRREVLAHVHARPMADGGAVTESEDAEHSAVLPEIPIGRTLLAEALRPGTLVMVAVAFGLLALPVANASVIPIIVGFVPSMWNLVDTSWRFSARRDADRGGLHGNYGLADRRRQAIRLSRIHGVRVSQPWTWRPFGWYEVHVSVAGYGTAGGKQSGSTRIVPVGTREQALAMFAVVSDLSPAEIDAVALPEGHTQPTFTSPRRAWWASPMDRARQSVTLHEGVAIVHRGRLTRRVMAVALPHIQEVTYKAGPLAQLLTVGTVRFELVNGPVKMAAEELEPADAALLMERLRARRLPELAAVPEAGDGEPEA